MYIWVPSEKKAELFYHISSQYVMAPEGDVYKIGDARKFVGDGFVKQNDVKVSGVELKPVNTPEEAEQDSKTAMISKLYKMKSISIQMLKRVMHIA